MSTHPPMKPASPDSREDDASNKSEESAMGRAQRQHAPQSVQQQ